MGWSNRDTPSINSTSPLTCWLTTLPVYKLVWYLSACFWRSWSAAVRSLPPNSRSLSLGTTWSLAQSGEKRNNEIVASFPFLPPPPSLSSYPLPLLPPLSSSSPLTLGSILSPMISPAVLKKNPLFASSRLSWGSYRGENWIAEVKGTEYWVEPCCWPVSITITWIAPNTTSLTHTDSLKGDSGGKIGN